MVELRGGLQGLNHTPLLQRVITWLVYNLSVVSMLAAMMKEGLVLIDRICRSDFAYSSTWSNKPLFPIVPQLYGSLATHKHILKTDTTEVLNPELLASPLISLEVLEIMHTLRLISGTMSKPRLQNKDRRSIGAIVYSVEHQLLTLKSERLESSPSSGSELDVSKILLIAAHLFLHLAIRELQSTTTMHIYMQNTLQSMLPIEKGKWQQSHSASRLLLWSSFIGAAAAAGQTNRVVFVKKLRIVTSSLKISSCDEFELILRDILWLDKFCGLHCSTIWDEIMMC